MTLRRAALIAAALAGAAGLRAAEPLTLRVVDDPPRAFGWQLGDVFERRVVVDVPRGWTLDDESLPPVGRPGGVAELRAIERRRESIDGGERLHLTLRYQLFVSPVEPRVLELRGFRLRVRATDASPDGGVAAPLQTALVDAWPLAAAPLAPLEPALREGLGELRPDAPLPQPDAATPLRRLAAWAVLAALLLGYLLHVYAGERLWARHRRPFARAYRELARVDWQRGDAALADGFRRLHRAFDESAGRALFADDAATAFAAAGSRFAPLRADIAAFFERSRATFFDTAPARPDEPARLLALARALRDLERGAA